MSDKKGKSDKLEDKVDFRWLKKRGRGGKNKEIQFYESFRYDGIEYSLYDCVYLFKSGEREPYVGKLIKIWKRENNDKVVKVLWFFRPCEISNYLQGVNVLNNEIFLATGVGAGLTNLNPLEAIAGKCNVVCISKDGRNRLPSDEELKLADYVFYRTFDVQNLTISDKLDEKIAVVDVELLLNKNNPQTMDLVKLDSVHLAADVKSLISAEDTVVADVLVNCRSTVASSVMKADKLTGQFLDLPKCHPSEKNVTAMPNNSVLVAGLEEMEIPKKDSPDTDGAVKFDAGLGSFLGDEEKQLTEKGDAAKPDNLSMVPSTSECVRRGQQITSKSSDSKRTELNKIDKDKAKSEDRPSKKLKLDGSSQKSFVSGSKKSVYDSPASNKVARPAGRAAEITDGGKLTSEYASISNTLGKSKFNGLANGKSTEKSDKVSVKQSKDLEICVSKPPQHPDGAAKFKDRLKLLREQDGTSEGISKKRKSNTQSSDKLGKVIKQLKDEVVGANTQVKELTQRPLDKSKWFTASPWKDRMKDAADQERLVLLQNLDPTYNLNEVEDIIWLAFHENCTVKIVQHTATSSPQAGQALAIFNHREVAQKVIQKLEQDCLILPNGRPLVGTNYMALPKKQSQYHGHLVIDKSKQQMQKDAMKREAVSTSHSAQSNTLEYEMALDWRLLQDRSDLCWKYLYKNQGEEMRKLKVRLKS